MVGAPPFVRNQMEETAEQWEKLREELGDVVDTLRELANEMWEAGKAFGLAWYELWKLKLTLQTAIGMLALYGAGKASTYMAEKAFELLDATVRGMLKGGKAAAQGMAKALERLAEQMKKMAEKLPSGERKTFLADWAKRFEELGKSLDEMRENVYSVPTKK